MPPTDGSCDGKDMCSPMEPDAEMNSEQPSPTPINPCSTETAVQKTIYVTIRSLTIVKITGIRLPADIKVFHGMHTYTFHKSKERVTEPFCSNSKTFLSFLWILLGDQLTYNSVLLTSKTRSLILKSHLYTGRNETILHNCFCSTNTIYDNE